MDIKDKKVDIIISVYGKPWETLCTLKSLMKWSGGHIDKIYFLEEVEQPFGDKVDWVMGYFNNIIHYKPKKYVNPYRIPSNQVPYENVRYQFGIDNSDKKYVFVIHNDVLFTGDIIGEMLNLMEDGVVGIGEIGQCWNCPAKILCGGGETWNDWNPTFEEINSLKLPHIRTRKDNLDKEIPKLMPECRVNEWTALINREICVKEGAPYFGSFDHDTATAWFKAMYKRGYRFKDYRKNYIHCFYAQNAGFQVQQNYIAYQKAEEFAKQYYKENYEQ